MCTGVGGVPVTVGVDVGVVGVSVGVDVYVGRGVEVASGGKPLFTWWRTLPLLVQVTSVAIVTVITAGTKAKSSIDTVAGPVSTLGTGWVTSVSD